MSGMHRRWRSAHSGDLTLPLVLLYSKGYQLGQVPCSDHFTIQEVAMTRPRHILSSLTCAVALILTLSGCSLTGTTIDFFSSTSGRSWFTEDGLIKAEHRVDAFVTLNFENLKQNMAQGHGEYLASLSTLMGHPSGSPNLVLRPCSVSLPICHGTSEQSRGSHCAARGEADNHGAPLTANYQPEKSEPRQIPSLSWIIFRSLALNA